MNSWNYNEIAEKIQIKLKQIVTQCMEEYDGDCNFEEKVQQKINERMYGFLRSSSFSFTAYGYYILKNSSYQVNKESGIVKGQIMLELEEKKDTYKYGPPGYPGNENGEVCQYPDYAQEYYQWQSFNKKWKNVTDQVCGNKRNSRSNPFMDNAAFGPI